MHFSNILIIGLSMLALAGSCKKKGCTDPDAVNYNAEAEKDNGSCNYAVTSENYQYGPDPIQQMKLYLPPMHDENTKIVVMVHGGGWVVGYNESTTVTSFSGRYGWNILNPLLDQGYACAVIKYRTACYAEDPASAEFNTEFHLNQMIEDIDLTIDYLKSNSTDLNIGDSHFQLLGESAGGHIVLSYAIQAEADETVKSAVSMFGPTALDDPAWKIGLHELDSLVPEGILVDGINYFRTESNSCELETNKNLSVLTELRSFGDHDTVKVYEENPYLQLISPATIGNIEKETPVFIMQGAEDILVPASQADIMYDAFLEKFPDAEVANDGEFNGTLKKMIYDNCGHGWEGGSCQKNQIMSDIVDWMNAH